MSDKAEKAEKELEAMKKELADARAGREKAEESAKRLAKEADRTAHERDLAEAELRATRTRPPVPVGARVRKGKNEPVVPEDIQNTSIRELFTEASKGSTRYADSDEGRAELAAAAQDALIALRLLKVGFAGHGVALHASGDLYIHGAGAHPREAAAHLVTRNDVGDLVELVDELREKLEYEAA